MERSKLSAATPEKRFEGIWSGYGQGTNRGKILVRIERSANGSTARAILYDEQLGITEAWLSGQTSGDKAEFQLLEVRGLAPLIPRQGEVTLNLKEDGTAEGEWHTDIGTGGVFRISRARFGTIGWYRHVLFAKASFFLKKGLPSIYGLFLVLLAIISIMHYQKISYPALILLLVPVPFIFRSQLVKLIELIHMARIKKLGPLEFEQNPPSREITAVVTQNVQESIVFAYLNQFFALRTKNLLAVLTRSNDGMSIANFRSLALSFGVPTENVDVTISAIVQANCAWIQNERIIPNELGQRYVQMGLRLP